MDKYERYKAEITVETVSVTTIRKRPVTCEVDHCERCGRDMIPLGDTALSSAGDLGHYLPGGQNVSGTQDRDVFADHSNTEKEKQ